jgi:hypothetical protein
MALLTLDVQTSLPRRRVAVQVPATDSKLEGRMGDGLDKGWQTDKRMRRHPLNLFPHPLTDQP